MGIIRSLEKTEYKNLRFGSDRFHQGNSNQPYVVEDINDPSREVGRTGGPDFIIRGGTLVPKRVANDVSRLTKMFFDLKSPNGPLFTAKQNILALTSTNPKAGFEPLTIQSGGSAVGDFLRNNVNFDLNNVYTPLSTIGQAAGGVIGAHLYKQGLNPLKGPSKYLEHIIEGDGKKSRLLNLTGGKLTTSDTTLYQYIGGPGSINGIGRTQVRRYENTNPNPIFLANNPGFLGYSDLNLISDSKRDAGKGNTNIIDFRNFSIEEDPEVAFGELPPIQSLTGLNNSKTLSLNYSTQNFESRINLGNPGRKAPRKDYQIGLGTALDELNAMSLYRGTDHNSLGNDFVKFRIGVIDNAEPNKKTFIHFRAILDDLSDQYTAEWNSEKLMGRGEQFYRYNGFTRTVNLAWTVAAQSKQELIPMYQKLNYLASSLTPYYSDTGYMGGNLISLTLGGWFYEQPGILTGMTLSVPQESPWEIAIPSKENTAGGNQESSDNSVKELPHIIKVTGVQFIPIHEFVPRLQKNTYEGPSYLGASKQTGNYLSKFGNERYIALSSGGDNNNYDKDNYLQLTNTDASPKTNNSNE